MKVKVVNLIEVTQNVTVDFPDGYGGIRICHKIVKSYYDFDGNLITSVDMGTENQSDD